MCKSKSFFEAQFVDHSLTTHECSNSQVASSRIKSHELNLFKVRATVAGQEVVASSENGLSEMAKLLEGQERRTFDLGEVPWLHRLKC